MDFRGREIDTDLVHAMCRSFPYRGPDDEGTLLRPGIGLGHRRLSIIDLSASGRQPMANEDASLWLVFNGEIYNFPELREELRSKGHVFRSRTDCETVLHLYEEEGTALFSRLDGMFAFALWDGEKKRLLLGRDRLGIKPLYYFADNEKLLFASEPKAILQDPSIPREIDPEALDLYLTLNHIPEPWSIFKGMKKLLPGTFLLAEEGGIRIETYWDLPEAAGPGESPAGKGRPSFEEGKARLRKLLERAVKKRLIADVPLGAFLSGGIDSSIIVGLMSRLSSRPVKTFSIGFKDLPAFDETAYAREVAEFNGTEHHEFSLGYRDMLEVLPAVLDDLDEPFADSSTIPTYIVSRETRKHVTVALSGDGGDEVFAGYRMYLGETWARYFAGIPRFIRSGILTPLVMALPDARDRSGLEKIRRIKKFLRGLSPSFTERFCAWRQVFSFPERRALLRDPPEGDIYLKRIRGQVQRHAGRFPGDTVNLMLYLDLKGLLPGDMLAKVDRMSMANSLEVRVPFLDHRLVEFMFTLPGNTKLRGRRRKHILLETFRDLLPPSLLERPKAGFEVPIAAWLRKELRFLLEEHLSKKALAAHDLFRYSVVKDLISDHLKGRRDTSWQLWNLIVFQHWFKTYMA